MLGNPPFCGEWIRCCCCCPTATAIKPPPTSASSSSSSIQVWFSLPKQASRHRWDWRSNSIKVEEGRTPTPASQPAIQAGKGEGRLFSNYVKEGLRNRLAISNIAKKKHKSVNRGGWTNCKKICKWMLWKKRNFLELYQFRALAVLVKVKAVLSHFIDRAILQEDAVELWKCFRQPSSPSYSWGHYSSQVFLKKRKFTFFFAGNTSYPMKNL